MNEDRYIKIQQISPVLFNLLIFRLILEIPVLTGFLPDSARSIFLVFLPLSLALQSIILGMLEPGSFRKYQFADWCTVSIAEIGVLLVLLFSSRQFILPMTGILIVSITCIRGFLLIDALGRRGMANRHCLQSLLFAFIMVSLLMPITAWRYSNRSLMGDEPYYLLISYSLFHDHDLDLINNYRNDDSLTFMDQRLLPQAFDDWRNDRLLSRHPAMLPALLIPAFIIGGPISALLMMNVFAAFLTVLLHQLLRRFDIPERQSINLSAITVMTAPMLFYSTALFTELPAAALAVYTLVLILNEKPQRKRYILAAFACALAATALKTRFFLLCFPPIMVGLVVNLRLRRRTWVWIALSFLLIALIGSVNVLVYGSPLGRYVLSEFSRLTYWRIFRGFVGLLLDQQYGLLAMNPLFLLAIPGTYLLYRSNTNSRFLVWLAAWLPTYATIALYAELTGGICPKGRFLTAWIPFLVVPLALCWTRMTNFMGRMFKGGLLLGSLIPAAVASIAPEMQIVFPGSLDTQLSRIAKLLQLDVLSFIPSFDRVEEGLIRSSLIILVVVFLLSLWMIRGAGWGSRVQSSRRFRTDVVSLSILTLLILILTPVVLNQIVETPWMHPEDAIFDTSGAARVFWEEPRNWDNWSERPPSPYRSGIRLHQGAVLERKTKLRYHLADNDHAAALEIRARASNPGPEIPILEIRIGNQTLGHVPIRSGNFESYVVRWPLGSLDILPPLQIENQKRSRSDIYVDIDKLRIVSWDKPWTIYPRDPDRILPVSFDSITIRSIEIAPRVIPQNAPFTVKADLYSQENQSDVQPGLLFLCDTQAFMSRIPISPRDNDPGFSMTIPPKFGTGLFDVFLQAQSGTSSEWVSPGGLQIFRSGKRAWVDRIQIDPAFVVPDENWEERISKQTGVPSNRLLQLDLAWHLSRNSTISHTLQTPVSAIGYVLVSHISSVFEEIPMDTCIGQMEISTGTHTHRNDIQLGRDTAESMYEFGGKEVRLAHPPAQILERRHDTLDWPPELGGIPYDALYYCAGFEFDAVQTVRSITVTALEFPGVWNGYALALVLP